jgi:phytol kinase
MINALIAATGIAGILFASEFLWRVANLKGEFARKFVHIVAGSYIAFLPFWVSYGWIMVLAVGFVLANVFNRATNIFQAIHATKRRSWGDLLLSFGILLTATIRPDPWFFAAAMLHVSLADGLAAVIGTKYGKVRYKFLDHGKSFIGSLTFFIVSTGIIALTTVMDERAQAGAAALLLVIPLVATMLENVSGYGTDNVTLPIGVLLLLNLFS